MYKTRYGLESGILILKDMEDLTDEETVRRVMLDNGRHYALDVAPCDVDVELIGPTAGRDPARPDLNAASVAFSPSEDILLVGNRTGGTTAMKPDGDQWRVAREWNLFSVGLNELLFSPGGHMFHCRELLGRPVPRQPDPKSRPETLAQESFGV